METYPKYTIKGTNGETITISVVKGIDGGYTVALDNGDESPLAERSTPWEVCRDIRAAWGENPEFDLRLLN